MQTRNTKPPCQDELDSIRGEAAESKSQHGSHVPAQKRLRWSSSSQNPGIAMWAFIKIFSERFLGPKAGDPAVTVTVSAFPPGLTVQCGDRLLDSDSSEWARLGWGLAHSEGAAAPAWGSGRASQRSYRSKQSCLECPTMELSLTGEEDS